MCLKAPVRAQEKVHCCVCWVAHSAPGHSAAVTLSLNSASSLSDVDECVGDLKRLFSSLHPQLSGKKQPMAPADRPQTDQVQGPWDSQRDSHLSQVHKNTALFRIIELFFPSPRHKMGKIFYSASFLTAFLRTFSTFILIFQYINK